MPWEGRAQGPGGQAQTVRGGLVTDLGVGLESPFQTGFRLLVWEACFLQVARGTLEHRLQSQANLGLQPECASSLLGVAGHCP